MQDTSIYDLISQEEMRQRDTLMLIPSENHTSQNVRMAVGSVLSNKYAEGYPHARYYQGNTVIDEIEIRAQDLAKKLFHVPHANVQPYSGSPANSAIYFGLLQHGDTIMGLKLSAGGHLTHGHPDITFSGKYFTSVQYDVDKNGILDMEAIAELARTHKPKIITVGTTAYPRSFDWQAWRTLADECGAILHADISHIAGLIAGGAYESPVPYADVVMFTTHKTLRGPRGAVILVTDRGLERDPDMAKKIDRAVFPGLQGGPHANTIAGIAIALEEASTPAFETYAHDVIKNARVLSDTLANAGLTLVTGGTDNHLMIIDLHDRGLVGNIVAEALEVAWIVVNRNAVPHDPQPPFYPSGIRIGTPAVTTRGMGEDEMKRIGGWIAEVIDLMDHYELPKDQSERSSFMKTFRYDIQKHPRLIKIATDVKNLCNQFPI